jgi:hypothetical protein
MSNSRQQKDMTGSLKPTNSDNPKYPHFKGSCTIGGVAYWVSCWDREYDEGRKLSLSFDKIGADLRKSKIAPEDVPGYVPPPPCTDTTKAGSVDDSDPMPF